MTLFPSGERTTSGFWSALDARTGAILWQTTDPVPDGWDAGMVTVANDVVYAGSLDPRGHMYALNAVTGTILWSYASGGSVIAGPAVVRRHQSVLGLRLCPWLWDGEPQAVCICPPLHGRLHGVRR